MLPQRPPDPPPALLGCPRRSWGRGVLEVQAPRRPEWRRDSAHSVTTAERAACLSQPGPCFPEPATPCSSPLETDSHMLSTWIFTLNL